MVSLSESPSGLGGAAIGEYAFAPRFSVYGMVLLANLGSGKLTGRANADTLSKIQSASPNAPGQIFQQADFDASSSFGIGAGINWRAAGSSPDRTTFNIFAGPTLIKSEGSGSASILEINGTTNDNRCGESFAGYNCVRRRYTSDNSDMYLQIGMQAGIPVGVFKFNPYMIAMAGAARESGTVKFDIPLNTGDGGVISEREFVRGISNLSAGLNATYRPWGLSANLTGSLATPLIEAFTDLNGFDIVKLQISKSFGKYSK